MTAPVSPSPVCARCGGPVGILFTGSGLCDPCAAAGILRTADDRLSPRDSSGDNDSAVPAQIGPYRIIEVLGRGGMGTVYLAQHRELGRIVALKAIPLQSTATDERRFLREAQTVAGLRHRHIVTVHDAGQDARSFYFAMDYVEGGDLAARLRERPFTPRAAVSLLHAVAEAVAYSHAQGVLHRDLKPSNILLDGDEPRVADFGLATPVGTGGDLTQHTSVLGTPHYLAPEALRKGSAAQSPASDVYSLGVMLYEMLCGRLPFTASAPVELQQLITSTEPLAPHLLAAQVPRDLDTICLKALAAEPARRYATAADLAEDLRRFLAGETILARPAGPAEKLWRWARRRPQLAALWLLTFLLAAGSTTAAWKINGARREAEAEAAKSRAVVAFLRDDLLGSSLTQEEPNPDLKLRTILDRATEKLAERFLDQPGVAEPISEMVGYIYHSLGDFTLARQHLTRALTLARSEFGPADERTLRLQLDLAEVERLLGHYPEARALFEDSQAHSIGTPALNLDAANGLGVLLINEGKLPEAAALLEPTLARARRELPVDSIPRMNLMVNLAGIYGRQDDYEPAIALLQEAIAGWTQTHEKNDNQVLGAMNTLGVAYLGIGRNQEAEAILTETLAGRRKNLGPDHPRTLVTLSALARAELQLGHADQSIALNRELLDTRRRLFGPEHVYTLRSMEALAQAYLFTQNYPEALPLETEVLTLRQRLLGPDHPDTFAAARATAYTQFRLGHHAEVIDLMRPFHAAQEQKAPASWQLAICRVLLGTSLLRTGHAAEAEPLLLAAEPVLRAQRAKLLLYLPALADEVPGYLAETYTALGRPDEAAKWAAVGAK